MFHEVNGIKIYERRSFGILTKDIVELMKDYEKFNGEEYRKYEGNLHLFINAKTSDVYLYDKGKFDIVYDETDMMECVGKLFGMEINHMFFHGDEYGGILYFIEQKLEQ
ncbi:MAG: hypothetical protein IJA10_10910 [Lachnospiraceae bacterium]|nr:hypothetical protein [Lachnospiraceae bacterium]